VIADHNAAFKPNARDLPNSNATPAITLSLTVGGHGKDGYVAPSSTEGEALALWDAIVKTLRLRPGTI
jgi:hypothetical protein